MQNNHASHNTTAILDRRFANENQLALTGPSLQHNERATTGLAGSSGDERRFVTILFCDVTGSTAMAEQLDPEDWADIMREAFDYLIKPIERYDGTVARLMGDAVLAFFGAPRAHEDDPRRAILAANDIIEGIQPLRERVLAQHGLDFNVRIGINSGLVIVGEFGSEQRFEYTAMGDAINLAARMEQTARPGTIQISHPTYRLIAPYFNVESVGKIELKGKSTPIRAYRVIGRKPIQTWGHGSSRHVTPLVGRERELEALRTAYEKLKAGEGHIVLLVGEAGTGKTRLIEELRGIWQRDVDSGVPGAASIAWLENRLVAYETTRPYAALAQRLRKVFGINRQDDPDQIRTRVDQVAQHFPAEARERAIRIIQRILLAEDGTDSGAKGADFQDDANEFREELFAVTNNLLAGWNNGGPLIFVGDDHHWFDSASAELMAHLFNLINEMPILFISVFRPDRRRPVWTLRDRARTDHAGRYTEIRLEPLAAQGTDLMLRSLVDVSNLPDSFRRSILEKADGNPLFIEEIIYALIDQGVLVQDNEAQADQHPRWRLATNANPGLVTIPDSLQALLMERIDRLPVGARHLLQHAAVIGRSFSVGILEAVAGMNGELDDQLALLEQLDIVRLESSDGSREFTFRHALLWEAAYNTILKRDRRVHHLRVAEAIEQRYADSIDEQAENLGRHYFEADDERGVAWLVRAAERAQSLYSPQATLEHSTRALQLLARLGQDVPARLYQLRARAFELEGKYDQTREDLEHAREIAREDEDLGGEWQALIELGSAWMERDYGQAREYLEDALELSRKLHDDRKFAHSLNRLGNWHANAGHPRKAIQAHQAALATSDILDDDAGRAEALDLLGTVHYLSGDMQASASYFEQAITLYRRIADQRGLTSSLALSILTAGNLDTETVPASMDALWHWRGHMTESLEIAQNIGWRAGEAFALNMSAGTLGVRGEYGGALANAERGREIAERIGHRQWLASASYALGWLHLELLQYEEAERYLTTALRLGEELRSEFWRSNSTAGLASAYLARGKYDDADALLDCRGEISYPPQSLAGRRCWYQRAHLELARGDYRSALDIGGRLMDARPPGSEHVELPHLALMLAKGHVGNGDVVRSREYLDAALEGAGRCGYRPLRWRSLVLSAELSDLEGKHDAARAAISEARMIVHDLASEVGDTDLRSRFLDRAEGLLVRRKDGVTT